MNVNNNICVAMLGAVLGLAPVSAQTVPGLEVSHLAGEQNIVAVTDAPRYLLLPVQEDAPEAKVGVISGNEQVGVPANVRLARERVDYYVPLDL